MLLVLLIVVNLLLMVIVSTAQNRWSSAWLQDATQQVWVGEARLILVTVEVIAALALAEGGRACAPIAAVASLVNVLLMIATVHHGFGKKVQVRVRVAKLQPKLVKELEIFLRFHSLLIPLINRSAIGAMAIAATVRQDTGEDRRPHCEIKGFSPSMPACVRQLIGNLCSLRREMTS